MRKVFECAESISRRTFLKASALLTFAALPDLALGAAPAKGRLLVILLRGGMDGLFAMPPVGDPGLKGKRRRLMSSESLKLDGFFALHPSLRTIHSLYEQGQALLVHGTSIPYTGRSHFDGQDIMESGMDTAYSSSTGWLGRALAVAGQQALTMSLPIPLILRGEQSVDSRYPSWISNPPRKLYALLKPMWAADRDFAEAGTMLAMEAEARAGMMGAGLNPGDQPSITSLASEAAARFNMQDGPRIAVIDHFGFDTHANQPWQHSDKLLEIDQAIREFRRGLTESAWKDTLVVTVTEFGRTIAENGSYGTEHGWGTCVFVVGGTLRKSGIVTDWPGLKPANLFEGRDLRVTIDARALYASIVSASLGIDMERVRKEVLNFSKVAAFDGYFA